MSSPYSRDKIHFSPSYYRAIGGSQSHSGDINEHGSADDPGGYGHTRRRISVSDLTKDELLDKLKEHEIYNTLGKVSQVANLLEVQNTLITKLLQENRALKEENHHLKIRYGHGRFSHQPPPPPKRIGLYVKAGPTTINNVHLELLAKVESILSSRGNFVLDQETWSHGCDNKPVIVFCLKASRIGTDIDTALQDVSDIKDIILVVLHHEARHTLRHIPSSKEILGTKSNVRLTVDAVFWEQDGLYECKDNDRAVNQLADYLQILAK